jgi:hypothetical protein
MLREEFKALFTKEKWMNEEEYDEMIDHILKVVGGLDSLEEKIQVGIKSGVSREDQLEMFKGIVNLGVKE